MKRGGTERTAIEKKREGTEMIEVEMKKEGAEMKTGGEEIGKKEAEIVEMEVQIPEAATKNGPTVKKEDHTRNKGHTVSQPNTTRKTARCSKWRKKVKIKLSSKPQHHPQLIPKALGKEKVDMARGIMHPKPRLCVITAISRDGQQTTTRRHVDGHLDCA